MWLVKCVISLVSEHFAIVSMLNSLKKCTKAFPSYCFITWLKLSWKMFVLVHLKSHECLLTHWLPISSILFVIGRSYGNQFSCNCLRKIKLFLTFLVNIFNLNRNLNILKKKMTLISCVFSKLQTTKDVIS